MSRYSKVSKVAKSGAVDSKYFNNSVADFSIPLESVQTGNAVVDILCSL